MLEKIMKQDMTVVADIKAKILEKLDIKYVVEAKMVTIEIDGEKTEVDAKDVKGLEAMAKKEKKSFKIINETNTASNVANVNTKMSDYDKEEIDKILKKKVVMDEGLNDLKKLVHKKDGTIYKYLLVLKDKIGTDGVIKHGKDLIATYKFSDGEYVFTTYMTVDEINYYIRKFHS